VGLGESDFLAPHPDTAEALGDLVSAHLEQAPDSMVTLDLRGLGRIYNDIDDFLEILVSQIDPQKCTALIDHGDTELAHSLRFRPWITNTIASAGPLFGWQSYNLDHVRQWARDPTLPVLESSFLRDIAYTLALAEETVGVSDRSRVFGSLINDALGWPAEEREIEHLLQLADDAGDKEDPFIEIGLRDEIEHFLLGMEFSRFSRTLHRHSMLVEFTLQANPTGISVVPYHADACYDLVNPRRDELLLGRPSVIASRTAAVFSDEIRTFESLLSSPSVKEQMLQRFLEEHPHFLQGLNYTNIYSQVVLERDDGTSLRPDFLLEPRAGEWCDILDLKLPSQNVFVGRRDRLTLASAIQEVAAQLREYSAYFENPRYRKVFRDRYGLSVYKPKLIAVVGRDSSLNQTEQHRRATTCYADLQILTFDHLLDFSRRRLLI
jgi:hypothetical protein